MVSLTQEGAISRYFYFYGKRSLNLVVNTGYAYTTIIGSIILMGCWIAQSEILFYAALSSLFQSFLNVQLSVNKCQKRLGLMLLFNFHLLLGSCIYRRIA